MRIAVTGGLGFIGSNFITYVLENYPKDTIINVDKETYAANHAYLDIVEDDSRYTFCKADIAILEEIERPLKDVDVIVNFAAESHVDNSIVDSNPVVRSNFLGTVNLLNIAREYSIRFHQVSTDEVFGSLPLSDESKFNENTCYNPKNPYSATKAAADHMVMAYYNTYSLPVTITHSSNNYGPHQHSEKLIPKTILNLVSGKRVPVYGSGAQIRDWLYVDDNCRAIDLVLRRGTIGQRYMIGGDCQLSNMEVVEKVAEILGKGFDFIEHAEDRPGHDLRYSSDFTKLHRELGWYPRIAFDQGIRTTVEHYLTNRDLYLVG